MASSSTPLGEGTPENAGYKTTAPGMFRTKDGSKIDLQISVPPGLSDWEAAREMIISSAKAAGSDHCQGQGLQHLAERSQTRATSISWSTTTTS